MICNFRASLAGASKKTIIIGSLAVIVIIILGLGVLAAHWKLKQLRLGSSPLSGKSTLVTEGSKNIRVYPAPDADSESQFVIPQDAAKSGELALAVNDLEAARNAISAVATKNSGSIYATLISYASNNIKNGSIMIQVPVTNFDSAFSDLKKVGTQVVQESTKQIPSRVMMPYPYPLSVSAANSATVAAEKVDTTSPATSPATPAETNTGSPAVSNSPASSVAPVPASIAMPIYYSQPAQDKGYIKIVFVDYGQTSYLNKTGNPAGAASILGAGYTGQNMRNNLLVVLAVKSILLIVLIALLVILAKRIISNLKKLRKNKPVVHVVRQMPRNSAKAVRFKK
jgi:hypothetical protein